MRKFQVLTLPFHDWRKIQKEGPRTRDAHLIMSFSKVADKVLVINRPVTLLEILLNRKGKINGERLFKRRGVSLYKVDENLYVLDYLSYKILGQIIKKHLWFASRYGDNSFLKMVKVAMKYLAFDNPTLISHTPFGASFLRHSDISKKVFDAYDYVPKFPFYQKIKHQLEKLYLEISSDHKIKWVTNSEENSSLMKKNFNVKDEIEVIVNGANTDLFSRTYEIPDDLKSIPKPWVGFGGKITHLFDYELFNSIAKNNPNKHFILVGQIIDQETFEKIHKASNVYYLGDKDYESYLSYATNFDIAIIPYKVLSNAHGGSSIKAFEFISARKKIVGTIGNGLESLGDYMYLTNEQSEFSKFLDDKNLNKLGQKEIPDFSWVTKAKRLIDISNLSS